jgi:hypothetical protein
MNSLLAWIKTKDKNNRAFRFFAVFGFLNFVTFLASSYLGESFQSQGENKIDFLVFYRAWHYLLTDPALVYAQIPNAGPTCTNDFSWCTGYNYGNSFPFTLAFSPLSLLNAGAAGWIFRSVSFLSVVASAYLVYKMFSKSWKIASILAIIIFFEPLPRFAFNPGDPFKYLDFLPPSVYIANYWAGQSDAIILFLFTLSLYFLSKDKIFLSCLAYALSFVKPEPIVLLPVYAAIVTFHFKERRERHFALKAIRSLIYVAGLVLLLNVAIILYPPWLSGYISLIQYRDKASMATDALTSLHEFVWLYPIPIISFAYVWQSTKPIAKQKLQSLEYNYGPLG